jgi:pilus assembly protein FimV
VPLRASVRGGRALAANKRKILENARKLAQKGAKEKALKEYQKLVKLDPKDAKLRLEIGDAYRRWGQVDDAIDTYTKVADQYMNEGFDARAVAVFKQILNLDPDRYGSYVPLAELYERMGLTAEAINALQTAADGYHRQGKKPDALELLRKMASIDPTNTTSRIKVADLLRQEEMLDEAALEYEQAALELERQGDVEKAGTLYRRILEMKPDAVPALSRLATLLLGRGKAAEAEGFAKSAMASEPDEPSHYERLAEVYRALDRQDALPGVYRQLAELHRRRGDEDAARDILQRFVPPDTMSMGGDDLDDEGLLDGGDDELGSDDSLFGDSFIGDGVAAGSAAPEAATPEEGLLDDPFTSAGAGDQDDDAFELEDEIVVEPPSPIELEEPAASAQPAASRTPAPDAPSGDPEQLLAEASVYLRYGKREMAIGHLEAILAGDPDHRIALEKLGEACAESDDDERAVEIWLRAAKLARADGDADAVDVLRGRIAALDEEAARSLAPSRPPAAEPPPAAAPREAGDEGPAADAFAANDFDIDIDIDADEDEAGALEAPEPPPAPAASHAAVDDASSVAAVADTSLNAASLSSQTTQQVLEDLEEADFYVQQGLLDEAEEIYKRVLSVAPNHPRALVRLGEVTAARGGNADAAPGVGTPTAGRAAPPRDAPSDEPGDWGDELAAGVAEEASEAPAGVEIEASAPDLSEVDIEASAPDLSEAEIEASTPDLPGVEIDVPELEPAGPGPAPGAPENTDTEELVGVDSKSEPVATSESAAPPPAAASDIGAPGAVAPEDDAEPTFDLAAELSEAFDDDPAGRSLGGLSGAQADDGFAAVFDAFKKGVSETLSETDHDAHYDLGIAYKEMGLYDDAMSEFRVAMTSDTRHTECLHLLGLCALDAGRPHVAVEHLTQLLDVADASDEQKLAARLDLGRAYQASGDTARARSAYQAVVAVDPDFCGAGQLLAQLGDPPEPAEPADDAEGFESFDDLLGESPAAEDGTPEADPGESFEDLIAEAESIADEPDDDPPRAEPAPASSAQPASPASSERKKRKKKISFF